MFTSQISRDEVRSAIEDKLCAHFAVTAKTATDDQVKRIGTDFLIVCKGCGHQLLMPRPKFEKAAKKIVSRLPENE